MKKSILNLGKTLNKATQQTINGGGARGEDGECVNYDRSSGTSSIGECDKNSIYSVPL
ncbi:hypothetical protein [Tenacibaculum finnmarkense]|uniref:hypothetical protein n=1 Tax=Tenacibaculum finnmarkense TaxID=2781243 RepID=UPI001E54AE41|nr:hypothetical protein [Tenacibaculum finnmarkense]MCD8413436.1 hypothetical protein [Tenacibaculum finnmarkense genomovar ulcerans]MCG8207431.1 hypothetical protein [Tenacibaculum finnmarkense genomovar finnmarkense]MCG8723542.1 hypothetical protein [Tenacibaculum finnmarkense]MCG8741773.1 hypothetical protein [Tenacibaculum finnmarkense]MCG8765206.1 hypothetical protein [Tenacibaculum finnmarkense]